MDFDEKSFFIRGRFIQLKIDQQQYQGIRPGDIVEVKGYDSIIYRGIVKTEDGRIVRGCCMECWDLIENRIEYEDVLTSVI